MDAQPCFYKDENAFMKYVLSHDRTNGTFDIGLFGKYFDSIAYVSMSRCPCLSVALLNFDNVTGNLLCNGKIVGNFIRMDSKLRRNRPKLFNPNSSEFHIDKLESCHVLQELFVMSDNMSGPQKIDVVFTEFRSSVSGVFRMIAVCEGNTIRYVGTSRVDKNHTLVHSDVSVNSSKRKDVLMLTNKIKLDSKKMVFATKTQIQCEVYYSGKDVFFELKRTGQMMKVFLKNNHREGDITKNIFSKSDVLTITISRKTKKFKLDVSNRINPFPENQQNAIMQNNVTGKMIAVGNDMSESKIKQGILELNYMTHLNSFFTGGFTPLPILTCQETQFVCVTRTLRNEFVSVDG